MASNPQHEPTMEEILASIRKIISEDSSESAPASSAAAHADSDVLELTQEVEELPPPPKPEPVRVAAPPPPPRSEPKPEPEIVFEPIEEPKPAPVAAAPAVSNEDIFSDKTRRAMEDTFAKIPAAVEPPAPAPTPTPRSGAMPGGDSVQAVFERAIEHAFDDVLHKWMDGNKADLMSAVKPLIREWMDEHFPPLLEGAVRNEVERVVKARGGK